uniref:Uncharacterized protein n=1 Tax=Anguilla anguilla TaxID=7936 RepID=A0A0E9RCZ4_ANGAN
MPHPFISMIIGPLVPTVPVLKARVMRSERQTAFL